MKPTLGRIVLFTDEDGKLSPAIITGLNGGDNVSLTVFSRSAPPTLIRSAVKADEPQPGRWNWPVIEDATARAAQT